jgi:hypothetical protein
MASENWPTKGLDYCRDTGEWHEWEQRLLAHIKNGNDSEIVRGVQYACDVMGRPWPELEPPMLDWLCAGGQAWADEDEQWAFTTYIATLGESNTLANEILDKRLSAPAIFYATRCIGGRWRQAEQMILDADTPHAEAVMYGYEDDSDDIENQITVYARDLIGGRWPAFEDKVRRRDCHPATVVSYTLQIIGRRWRVGEECLLNMPDTAALRGALVWYARDVIQGRWKKAEDRLTLSTRHMLAYATEVVKGPLPTTLRNAMTFASSDENVQEYFDSYGR